MGAGRKRCMLCILIELLMMSIKCFSKTNIDKGISCSLLSIKYKTLQKITKFLHDIKKYPNSTHKMSLHII